MGSAVQENVSPFLNIPLLIEAAKAAKADAIHPGYGYLSENPEFADAVRNAGIIFIGPTSQAILTLGDKRGSKEYLSKHSRNVPLIPGFAGISQDSAELERAADTIGYPVMLKASAGGGGKGIRIIHERAALKSELERAQSEAARSFGSSDCILEKYIEAGKHVEVQIIGDRHGHVISLFERECSVQRRHQKIIEESPCPWLTPAMRQTMCDAACEIGKVIAYEGAGTVEFIVDVQAAKFYFLEVNSRIQVEHPITEEVSGVDLVALQLYVAANGNLDDLPLSNLSQNGHAIECRLYAENPHRGFLPELGTIHLWQPASDKVAPRDEVRYETAIISGTEITMSFDPMIAKIVVWAPDRDAAIRRMVAVLANTACVGLMTNQLFLQSCLLHPAFHDPSYTTSFVGTNLDELLKHPYGSGVQVVTNKLSAIPGTYLKTRNTPSSSKDPYRRFQQIQTRFRNQTRDKVNKYTQVTLAGIQKQIATDITFDSPMLSVWDQRWIGSFLDEKLYQVSMASTLDRAQTSPSYESLTAAERLTAVYTNISDLIKEADKSTESDVRVKILSVSPSRDGSPEAGEIEAVLVVAEVDDIRISGTLVLLDGNHSSGAENDAAKGTKVLMHVPALGTWVAFETFTLLAYLESLRPTFATAANSANEGIVSAPMPCKVLRVLKTTGDTVEAGEIVVVVESMKMEMTIAVNTGGRLTCTVTEGQAIKEGEILCTVE